MTEREELIELLLQSELEADLRYAERADRTRNG